jgi:hypothetical protein
MARENVTATSSWSCVCPSMSTRGFVCQGPPSAGAAESPRSEPSVIRVESGTEGLWALGPAREGREAQPFLGANGGNGVGGTEGSLNESRVYRNLPEPLGAIAAVIDRVTGELVAPHRKARIR